MANPVVDPVHKDYPDVQGSVLYVDATIDYTAACKIFNSCSAINFISALGASASTQGFFNLQSSQAVSQGNMYINFKYQMIPDPAIVPYVIPVNQCNDDFTSEKYCDSNGQCYDPQGYALFQSGKCPCLTCESACKPFDYGSYIQERTITTGFNPWAVLITFGVVVAITIAAAVWAFIKKKVKQDIVLRKASMDSEYNVKGYMNHDVGDPSDYPDISISEMDDDDVAFNHQRQR